MELSKVAKILSKQLNIKEASVKPSSRIVEDLGADSLDVVELLMTLEEEYNISIDDDKVMEIKTVQDILDIIAQNQK